MSYGCPHPLSAWWGTAVGTSCFETIMWVWPVSVCTNCTCLHVWMCISIVYVCAYVNMWFTCIIIWMIVCVFVLTLTLQYTMSSFCWRVAFGIFKFQNNRREWLWNLEIIYWYFRRVLVYLFSSPESVDYMHKLGKGQVKVAGQSSSVKSSFLFN